MVSFVRLYSFFLALDQLFNVQFRHALKPQPIAVVLQDLTDQYQIHWNSSSSTIAKTVHIDVLDPVNLPCPLVSL